MTQQNSIINHWSLCGFVRTHGGHIFIGECTNSKTGDTFKSLAVHNGDREDSTLVNFSSKLGELTGAEIKARKNSLQVVELEVDSETLARRKAEGRQLRSFILCAVGEGSWEEIDLGL